MSRKLTYSYVKSVFSGRNYILISEEYVGNKDKLDYICENGHRGSIRFNDFSRGHGCPICSGNKLYTIEEVKDIFNKAGYNLITSTYNNSHQKLEYICPNGHRGSIAFYSFVYGRRCPVCASESRAQKRRRPIEEVRAVFAKDNYTLISKEYKNNKQKLEYICPNGHSGSICLSDFLTGYRCAVCAGNAKHSFPEVKAAFLSDGYELISIEYTNNKQKLDYVCPKGHKWNIAFNDFQQGKRCPICVRSVSKKEIELQDFVEGLGLKIIRNSRKIIAPKELDIFIPSKNLAIEYCGLYWHSELMGGKERKYHRNKLDLCRERNIRLITIFEDEYINYPEVVKSRIKNALGIIENKIYARKCVVKEISSKEGRLFLGKYHLQGSGRAKYYFGLFYENELLLIMSFGAPARAHARKKGLIELKRMCNKPGTSIVGGVSKVFKFCSEFLRNEGFTEVVSYCDMRWAGLKPIYEKLGFFLVRETKYTPHYITENYSKRVRNQGLSIKPEERDLGKTERELRFESGYDIVWDCGHRTYLYNL